MKRFRSIDDDDDTHSFGERGVVKDWGRRDGEAGSQRSSPIHRSSSYYKTSDSGRKFSSSTSRYDMPEEAKEGPRMVKRRSDYDLESYDRRKGYDRQREGSDRGILCSSPRTGYGGNHLHRSQSFSGHRRDVPKGFRSDRDRPKREGIGASWRKFGAGKDGDDRSWGSSESARMNQTESKEVGKTKNSLSSQGSRDAKSPAWSKDSGSELSKSVDGKKCEDGSEREEGELDPDHQPNVRLKETATDGEPAVNSSEKEVNVEDHGDGKLSQDKPKPSTLSMINEDANIVESSGDLAENVRLEDAEGAMEEIKGRKKDSLGIENEISNNVADCGYNGSITEGRAKISDGASSLPEEIGDKGIKDQVKDNSTIEEKTVSAEFPSTEKHANQNLNDKGKGIALPPSEFVQLSENNMELENKLSDHPTSIDIETEGPSSRGFQFFSNDPIKKLEIDESLANSKDDKLALELSLSLPNVLMPKGSQNRVAAPTSPSQTRSVHSFASTCRTLSDGFTASMSFSGTQQFTHNPSCSLTHNIQDNEQSVKSRPLFQGVDWKALSSDENKNIDFQSYLKSRAEENGLPQQSHLSKGDANGEALVQHGKAVGEISKQQIVFDAKIDFNRHLSGGQYLGSYENGLDYSNGRRKMVMEKEGSNSQRFNDGKIEARTSGFDFAEATVSMIVSEPIRTMSQKFNDMSPKQLASVKEFIHEIISNPVKQWQLTSLQAALLKRQDVSLDMLLNAQRSQLEIMVALKTGFKEFILKKSDTPSSELAEIFLNMRCRNLKCKSLLPVDECDCKICTERSDFCRECMCLVCSKFDNAANTCSWVGCDVCLHWCHADCGLRESYIRVGHGVKGAAGTTKVQFYCVACGHPSEMFGFVKEVFLSFVNVWTAEILSRELEFVKRIFCTSEDVRGKQLHELAVQMKTRIANRTELSDVRNMIMKFFTETKSEEPNIVAVERINELPVKIQESINANASSSQGKGWLRPVYQDKNLNLEGSMNSFSGFDQNNRNGKQVVSIEDIKKNAQKDSAFDELETMIRIKLAEASMFQDRADDARRESEALRRISVSKNERIEEEYTTRINRLRLAEAEDIRKQKIEELQGLERAYQEYFDMKMRMETDIKDLLLKMEAKRRNLVK